MHWSNSWLRLVTSLAGINEHSCGVHDGVRGFNSHSCVSGLLGVRNMLYYTEDYVLILDLRKGYTLHEG